MMISVIIVLMLLFGLFNKTIYGLICVNNNNCVIRCRKECGNIGEKQGSGVVSTGHYEAALLYLVPCGATFTRPRAAERSVPVLRPRLGEYIRQDCESRDWKNMNVATHDTCRSSPVTCLNHVLETDDFGLSEVTGNKGGGETTQRHQILSW